MTVCHTKARSVQPKCAPWLLRYLMRYIRQDHRSEQHSRIEDWLANFPSGGIRQMCAWEQYCRFAGEPERRRVGARHHTWWGNR